MRFKVTEGRLKTLKNAGKYRIKWRGKSRSKFQKRVKDFLKEYWGRDIVFEEFPVVGTRYTLDFYNANKKVAVEVQGAQHLKFVEFFHQNRGGFAKQFESDIRKAEFCERNDITLVEIYPDDELSEELFERFNVIL